MKFRRLIGFSPGPAELGVLEVITFEGRADCASHQILAANVQLGHERRIGHVRSISGLAPGADIEAVILEPPLCATSVCEQVQQATCANTTLLSHVVGSHLQGERHCQPERLGGFKIDH